ncbi:MAG: GNAT family N-acetyltransferase [Chloroflexota bacterium]
MPAIHPIQTDQMPALRRLLAAYILEWDPDEDPDQYWHEDYWTAFRAGLAHGTLAILLVWPQERGEGEPIGFAIARVEPAWYRASWVMGIVEEFYIAPAYRRRGLGRALADRAAAQLHDMGATGISAYVLRRNTRALQFWQRIGFSIEVHQLYRRTE